MNQWKCPNCGKPTTGPEFIFIGTGKELKEFLIDRCGCMKEVEDKCQED